MRRTRLSQSRASATRCTFRRVRGLSGEQRPRRRGAKRRGVNKAFAAYGGILRSDAAEGRDTEPVSKKD